MPSSSTRPLKFYKPGEKRPRGPELCADCGRRGTTCEQCRCDIETCVASVQGRLRPLPAHLQSRLPIHPLRRLPSAQD